MALRKNIALLIEKPLGVGLEGVPELKSESAKSTAFVSVAYVLHLLPSILVARDCFRTGVLGKPL